MNNRQIEIIINPAENPKSINLSVIAKVIAEQIKKEEGSKQNDKREIRTNVN